MTHDRDFSFCQPGDQLQAAFTALHLHGLGASFLYETHGIVQRIRHVRVIAAVRHVGHKKRTARSAPHGASVVQHLIDRYCQRALMPQHDHAERIADKDQIHTGFVEQPRGRIVIRRQASDFLEVGR